MGFATFLADAPLGRFLIHRRDATRHRRHRMAASRAVAALMAVSAPEPPPQLEGRRVLPTGNDVVIVRSTESGRGVLVKFALTAQADVGLSRHIAMLDALAERQVPVAVPEVLRSGALVLGRHGLRRFVEETALPGAPLPVSPHPATVASALHLVDRLHRSSAVPVRIGEAVAASLVDGHLATLAAVSHPQWPVRVVDELGRTLRAALMGRELSLAVTHGDLWPGNVLGEARDDGSWTATGLVDWENGSPQGLPEVDMAHYLLSLHPTGPAAAVLQAIGTPRLSMAQRLAPYGVDVMNPELPAALCTVLAWLAHVAGGIDRAHHSGPGRAWLGSVVAPVLDLVARDDCGWRHAVAHWSVGVGS